jgi:hypothetical protein
MNVTELPDEVIALISHIKNWQAQISDEVATILLKLSRGEDLSRPENALDITPSELAALLSVTNKTPISVDHTRQIKREGRIRPSKEWGVNSGRRNLYRVRDVKDVKASHSTGRPTGSRNKRKQAA